MGKRGPPPGRGVVEIYNGEILAMRKDGDTLQSIGDKIGVTRERVRQILNQYYGGTKTSFLSEHQVAVLCGCSDRIIGRMREQGLVNPRLSGHYKLYDRDEVEKAYLAYLRQCAMCGASIGLTRKYCKECTAKRQRYFYPYRSQEGKEKARKATQKWRNNHPEQLKIIQARAMKKFNKKRSKIHFAETWYEVTWPNAVLPMGTVFQAVGRLGGFLLLADGLRIPMKHFRKRVLKPEGEEKCHTSL